MRDFGILVVDESRDAADVMERIFGHFRVKVDLVTSAAAALDCLATRDFSAMIINFNSSDLKGFELTNRARELFPQMNIVIFACSTPAQILLLIFDGKVSEISGNQARPCGFGDMCTSILKKERGKTFLIEQVARC